MFMNMVWLLLVLFCVQGITSEGISSRNEVVKVGAIFSLSSVNGKVSKIAIEAAEKDVNSDPSVLGGRKLSISIHDANYSGFLGITGGILLFIIRFLHSLLSVLVYFGVSFFSFETFVLILVRL